MRIRKYYPFAFIYFFVNSLGLPFGLLYTMILTPVFYVWILLKGKREIIIKFLLVASPFILNHLLNGVDTFQYFRSIALFFTVYVFCYAFYTLITTYNGIEEIFRKLLIFNFILTIIAVFFIFTPYRDLLWNKWFIEIGQLSVTDLPRLMMFTYEPSYYATLLVPIVGFYLTKTILKQPEKNPVITLIMVLVPLLLSFSMGVIAGVIVAIGILFLMNLSILLTSKRLFYSFIILTTSFVLTITFLFIFFPENPFFVRIIAIVSGADASANGRTFQAFELAHIIAAKKSLWWGVGPGQLKIIGDAIIKDYYRYRPGYGQVSIPSAFPETIALFGYIGAGLRLFIELYLFFKTRVLNSYYRTFLFFYIFVYQFTGSFTTNIAEYVIWILAFTNIFPQFDKKRRNRGNLLEEQQQLIT